MLDSTGTMSIGELARQTGLSASALRYYERFGLLPSPLRISGQRRYEMSVLKLVRFIQAAQRAGFTLDEIKRLIQNPPEEKSCATHLRELARAKLREVNALIARATATKKHLESGLNCQCLNLDECLLFN